MYQSGAYKLRQFTEPITRYVISTVQKLIKGMQRTVLNRHRRGYVTAEAATGVHFPVPGPIWARPVSIFIILPTSFSSSPLSSHLVLSTVLRSYLSLPIL